MRRILGFNVLAIILFPLIISNVQAQDRLEVPGPELGVIGVISLMPNPFDCDDLEIYDYREYNLKGYFCSSKKTSHFEVEGQIILFMEVRDNNRTLVLLQKNNGELVEVLTSKPQCGPEVKDIEEAIGCRWYPRVKLYFPPDGDGKTKPIIFLVFDDNDHIVALRVICHRSDQECKQNLSNTRP